MTTRTDVHRPSVINPDDYDFVGCECVKLDGDIGSAGFIITERAKIRRHMERTGGTYSHHAHGGNCHVCGASAIYTCLFYHKPTNTYVRTGEDCADKLGGGDIGSFRRQATSALEQVAGKRKAKALLEAVGIPAAWDIYIAAPKETDRRQEHTLRDIVAKLVQYGSLSDGQMSYLRSLAIQIARRPEIDAQRAAETAAAAPVPVSDKRMTVRGTIVWIKKASMENGLFADRLMILHDDGWKMMGGRPVSLADARVGDKVEFSARVKPSEKDPKFGFYSRPTKGSIISGRD